MYNIAFGLSGVLNLILIGYLLYIYFIKRELRENKNVEYAEVNPETSNSQDDNCAKCLAEHKIMINEIEKLKEDITILTSTNQNLNNMSTIIRDGMDRLMQAATRSNITITP